MKPSSFNPASRLQAHRRIVNEPHWQPVRHFTCKALAPGMRTWLTDDGSLTARLMTSGHGAFSVQRLYQGWDVPLPSERVLLELPARQLALVREVALRLGGETVVFARSVFPISSLAGSLAHLRRLQNKSLGAILFKHPGMHRHPFELALMAGDSDYLPASLKQAEPAWGRRSRFEIAGKRLMVSEVFLSAFTPWQESLRVHRTQRGKVSSAFRASTR
ncbi:MAG: chorismate lyase [Halioglobus sp.]|nr:chorismate lyase [Halioglobus sp.]